MYRFVTAVLIASFVSSGLSVRQATTAKPESNHRSRRLRRPVALALVDHGKSLCVANQRSGSISIVDAAKLQPIAEWVVGRGLADLTAMPDGRHLLAVDEAAHELILLEYRDRMLNLLDRVQLSAYPVSVLVDGDGSQCFVASLWSRRLTVVEISRDGESGTALKLNVANSIALPFAPRKQLFVRDGKTLIVADSFGGRLGIVDVKSCKLQSVRTLPAHNIRGLSESSDRRMLVVSHQILNRLARTTADDIHWGVLMTNNLRLLSLDVLLAPETNVLKGSHLAHLGDVGGAGGDPADVTVLKNGQVVVALAGVGEIAIGQENKIGFQRLAVGSRPTDVLVDASGQIAYVANTFSDSVSVVNLKNGSVQTEIPLGPRPKLSDSDRGELLFYDARLSHDSWMSCHSCHTDGHSNGMLNDNLGDGSFGAPKRVLSLLGVGDTGPWAWNGGMKDLPSQIRKSVQTTMRGKELAAEQVKNLTAYLRSLSPPPSINSSTNADNQTAIKRGNQVYRQQGCASCHAPPNYTSSKTFDIGIADEVGQSKFNPPSLRGVRHRDAFFHDNRARRLDHVFTRHDHQLRDELSKQQLSDLLAFLRSL